MPVLMDMSILAPFCASVAIVIHWFCFVRPLKALNSKLARELLSGSTEHNNIQLNEAQAIAQIGSWSIDLKTQKLLLSSEMLKLYSLDKTQSSDLLEKQYERIHPEDREIVKNARAKCSIDGKPYLIRFRIFKQENILWIEGRGRGKKNAEGQVVEIAGTNQNITDRVNLEGEIKSMVQLLNLGIWRWNIKENILIWDENMYKVFGIHEGDFNGAYSAWESTLLEEDKALALNSLQMAIRGEKNFDTSFRIKTKLGEIRHIGARGFVIRDKNGEAIQMFGLNWDRTNEEEAVKDLELERARALYNEKMAALGEMAAGVAHEINTPLGSIILNAHLILSVNQELEVPNPAVEKYAQAIDRVGFQISALSQNMKMFSGVAHPEKSQIFHVKKMVDCVISFCRERLESENIEISILDNLMQTQIHGQFNQLSQAMLNILQNAIDAIQKINEKWIRIEAILSEDFVEIVITDSGAGLSPAVADKIFRPFFTTKKVGSSAGLSLSVSQRIVENQGGKIIYDRSSKNTRFVLRLPIHK